MRVNHFFVGSTGPIRHHSSSIDAGVRSEFERLVATLYPMDLKQALLRLVSGEPKSFQISIALLCLRVNVVNLLRGPLAPSPELGMAIREGKCAAVAVPARRRILPISGVGHFRLHSEESIINAVFVFIDKHKRLGRGRLSDGGGFQEKWNAGIHEVAASYIAAHPSAH